jgi:predicted transcriptional regulator
MKTIKKVPVQLIEIKEGEYIPNEMEYGILYYSKEYKGLGHLCCCGCGQKTYIPIKEGEWSVYPNNGKVTVTPSLQQLNGCKSHYIITDGFANIV